MGKGKWGFRIENLKEEKGKQKNNYAWKKFVYGDKMHSYFFVLRVITISKYITVVIQTVYEITILL